MTKYEKAFGLAIKETQDVDGIRNLIRHYFAFLLMKDSPLPYSPIGKNANTGKYFRTIQIRTPKFFQVN